MSIQAILDHWLRVQYIMLDPYSTSGTRYIWTQVGVVALGQQLTRLDPQHAAESKALDLRRQYQ